MCRFLTLRTWLQRSRRSASPTTSRMGFGKLNGFCSNGLRLGSARIGRGSTKFGAHPGARWCRATGHHSSIRRRREARVALGRPVGVKGLCRRPRAALRGTAALCNAGRCGRFPVAARARYVRRNWSAVVAVREIRSPSPCARARACARLRLSVSAAAFRGAPPIHAVTGMQPRVGGGALIFKRGCPTEFGRGHAFPVPLSSCRSSAHRKHERASSPHSQEPLRTANRSLCALPTGPSARR